jgi:hypothetical protein
VRSIPAIAVLCALAVSFVQAPLAHTHEFADRAEHHALEQAHFHVHAQPVDASIPAVRQLDPASDERAASWFLTTQHSGVGQHLAPAQIIVPEPPRTSEFVRPAPLLRSHDPPLVLGLPSRAPPVQPA